MLPYVALVQEKAAWLRKALDGVEKGIPDETAAEYDYDAARRSWWRERKVRVVGFFGGSKARATWADVDIVICTIEKVGSYLFVTHELLNLKRMAPGTLNAPYILRTARSRI